MALPLTPIRRVAWFLCLSALLAVAPPQEAAAEIYRWTDAQGDVHFTQDLSQVPARYRRAAKDAAREQRARPTPVQTYSGADAPASRVTSRRRSSGGVMRIPFEKHGNAMLVYARVNDRVTAPFVVDTGASDVAIPAAVATRAGITVGPDTPHATYQTANGLVRKPVVTVGAVSVGEVRVEGLRGSISDSMQVGLLGGTFFNNFTFQIDPGARIITLVPNDRMRGGLSRQEWTERFRVARGQLLSVERFLEENELSSRARILDLERKRANLEDRLAELEDEADVADVPHAWREG